MAEIMLFKVQKERKSFHTNEQRAGKILSSMLLFIVAYTSQETFYCMFLKL